MTVCVILTLNSGFLEREKSKNKTLNLKGLKLLVNSFVA